MRSEIDIRFKIEWAKEQLDKQRDLNKRNWSRELFYTIKALRWVLDDE